MAKSTEDRNNKRQKLDGDAAQTFENAKILDSSPASLKHEMSLRPRGKESPQENLTKKSHTNEHGKRQSEIITAENGEHPDVHNLKLYIQNLGGTLEDGWHVNVQRRSGKTKLAKTFISPRNERFRSRVEVAKHLGLSPGLKKEEPKITQAVNRKGTQVVKVGIVKMKGSEKKVQRSPPKDKEHGASISARSHGKAVVNKSSAVNVMAPDTTKAGSSKNPLSASLITQRCEDVMRSIISADNFAALSNLLNRGSSSGSADGSLDFQLIYLRLSTGAYGQTPELFSADIQQVWKNIVTAGNEQVALGKSLSELSDNLYKQQILNLSRGSSRDLLVLENLHPSFQHDKHSIDENGFSQDDSHTLQGNQLAILPESTPIQANKVPDVIPSIVQGNSQDLNPSLKQARDMSSSQKKKKRSKKSSKSKKRLTLKVSTVGNATVDACKICGLQLGQDSVVCKLCSGAYHMHCLDLPSNTVPANEWCCPSCTATEVLEAQSTGKDHGSKVKVVLKSSDAASEEHPKMTGQKTFHANAHEHMDTHDHPVCERISRDSSSTKHVSTEAKHPQGSSVSKHASHESSPVHSAEHVAPEHESSEASMEDGSPEAALMVGNENACKLCGVESTKSFVSCSGCLKRYHLSCLRPSLKRVPRTIWYCPSCLCQACKVDTDDDKILLCDSCDEGYHTYCLKPPLSEIPKGSWFCPLCAETKSSSPRQMDVLKRKRKSTEPRRSI